MGERDYEDMAAKAEKPLTLLGAINDLEALEGELTEFLKISRADGGIAGIAAETAILTARNRILQINGSLREVLENLEKKRVQLQTEFGEPLL